MKNAFKVSLGLGATVLGLYAIHSAVKAHENKWDAKARIAEAKKEENKDQENKNEENKK